MRISDRKKIMTVLAPAIAVVMLIVGCGNDKNDCTTAPAGSSIIVSGPGTGASYGSDTPVNYSAVVNYPDGAPMPEACLTIFGTFAFPRNSTATGWHYQFYLYPNGTQNSANVAVNNGFSVKTDDFGQYTFSAEISVATGTFVDTITVQSGANFGIAAIENN